MSRHSAKKGFTLIELLVVVAIIGLLSSIVLASLNSARGKAFDARRFSDIRQFGIALELYANDNNGVYPCSSTQGTATCPAVAGSHRVSQQTDVTVHAVNEPSLATKLASYIKTDGKDPTGGALSGYYYCTLSNYSNSYLFIVARSSLTNPNINASGGGATGRYCIAGAGDFRGLAGSCFGGTAALSPVCGQ